MLKSAEKMKTRQRAAPRPRRDQSRLKPPSLSQFARKLLKEWRRLQLPVEKQTTIVGVSGGADSVALLLALDELIKAKKLKLKIVVAHVDHQLRKTSRDDSRWVRKLTRELRYEISVKRLNLTTRRDNLEQAARNARYKGFAALAQKRRASLVLTAHTLDDQAETILLNLIRGSGADGLSGIDPVRMLDKKTKQLLARPLLSWARRSDTERYCRDREIDFRHDEMNEDEKFARVRVRRQIVPLMQTLNPRIVEAVARTGELLRDDDDALTSAAERLLELSLEKSKPGNLLRVDLLADSPPALRRRALRLWLERCRGDLRRLELTHIRAVETLVVENRGARTIELPGHAVVTRNHGLLGFKSQNRGAG
jgi:tRNA(Ile)-lysidine synthase